MKLLNIYCEFEMANYQGFVRNKPDCNLTDFPILTLKCYPPMEKTGWYWNVRTIVKVPR